MIRPLPLLVALLTSAAAPALAQLPTSSASLSLQPADPSDPVETLGRYLRVLSTSPRDLEALTGAGRAALDVGDANAAIGFYARAEEIAPRDGRIKAGLASALVQMEQPKQALKLFGQAVDLGVPAASIAADRGLAYDLAGENRRAQADYVVALKAAPNDETVRRLALSQAISGDRASALATLDPLIRRQDRAAWRASTFVLALTGDEPAATQRLGQLVSPQQASALAPFLAELASLKPAQQAQAVHFGHLPTDKRSAGTALAAADNRRSETTSPAVSAPVTQTASASTADARLGRARGARRRPGDQAAPAEVPGTTPATSPGIVTAARTPSAAAGAGAFGPAGDSNAPAQVAVIAAPTTPAPAPAPPQLASSAATTSAAAVSAVDPRFQEPAPAPRAPMAAPATGPTTREVVAPVPARDAPAQPTRSAATASRIAPAKARSSAVARADDDAVESSEKGRSGKERQAVADKAAGKKAKGVQLALADKTDSGAKGKAADARGKGKAESADAKADSRSAKETAKADKAKKAAADEKEAKAKLAAAAKKAPERYWVQVATGAYKADLPKAWANVKAKYPQLMGGRTAWTTPLRFTNRVLVGPFKSDDEAQAFVNTAAKAGFGTSPFTSSAGQAVERIGAK